MNITTGPDGAQWIEFDGEAMVVTNGNPYTAAKLFEMRGAMWDQYTYRFSFTPYTTPPPSPPPEPPQPHGRFLHLDWE